VVGELGLPDRLAWQMFGLIDDAPVIQIRMPSRRNVLLDLARFAHVELPPSSGGAFGEPVLELTEPDGADVRARLRFGPEDNSAGPPGGEGSQAVREAEEDQVREEMQNVTIAFSLPGAFRVRDASATRVLRWG
jgi:hypothetical protein